MSESNSWQTIAVSDNTQMGVFIARPQKAAAKVPAIIVLQEIFGVNAYMQDIAQRIANLGYIAFCPDLFHRKAPGFIGDYENMQSGIEQMKLYSDDNLIADLKATYDYAQKDSQVDAESVAAVGYCMGGRAAYLANAELPLKAAVSYYGAGIAPGLLHRANDQHGVIMLLRGGKDQHITREKQDEVAEALRACGKTFVDIEFSDADHGFFCDARKSYHPQASRESWALFTAFLKDHLEGKS